MFRLLMSLGVCLSVVGAAKLTGEDYEGRWYNELGSCMHLKSRLDQQLYGNYVSPSSSGPDPAYGRVVGQFQETDDTFSFSVTWNNYPSTTGWAGEYKEVEQEPVLFTTWLLVSATECIDDLWENTQISQDEFYREPQIQNDCDVLLDELMEN